MSRRRRRDWARVDVGLFSDVKVVRLARLQKSPELTAVSVSLYVATILASWTEDKPVPLADAAPPWYLDDVDRHVRDLTRVGMLDAATGAIPVATLDRWLEFVRSARASGSLGARSRWGSHSDPIGVGTNSDSDPNAYQTKTRRSLSRSRENGADRMEPPRATPTRVGSILDELLTEVEP